MKKFKSVILVSALLLIQAQTFAGDKEKISFQLEFGGNNVNTTLNDVWQIRQDVGSSDYYGSSSVVNTDMYVTQLGIKPEMSFFDNKFAISSGLRYYNVQSNISIYRYGSSLPAYFYLRYANSGLNTEYAKVYGIDETSHYLGIPLELKFTPLSLWKFDFYLKTGIDFGFKLGTRTDISFVNSGMEEYENQILTNLGVNSNTLFSTWYSAIGVTFGDRDKLRYSLDILLPSIYISGNNSTLVNNDIFTGFRLSLQLPVK